MEQERIDEALELVWLLEEEGRPEFNRFRLNSDDINFDEMVNKMIKNNLNSKSKIVLKDAIECDGCANCRDFAGSDRIKIEIEEATFVFTL